ncbi:MAG: hypothetical protein JXR03_18700 [Cyclobacteriaceae bacterium]
MTSSEKRLRNTLKLNVVFTTASAFSLVFLKTLIAEVMNVPLPEILLYIGVGLLLFAGLLIYSATRTQINPKLIKLIIVQDGAWVTGSAVLISLQLFEISLIGNIMIGVIAMVVGLFAVLQYKYLK